MHRVLCPCPCPPPILWLCEILHQIINHHRRCFIFPPRFPRFSSTLASDRCSPLVHVSLILAIAPRSGPLDLRARSFPVFRPIAFSQWARGRGICGLPLAIGAPWPPAIGARSYTRRSNVRQISANGMQPRRRLGTQAGPKLMQQGRPGLEESGFFRWKFDEFFERKGGRSTLVLTRWMVFFSIKIEKN